MAATDRISMLVRVHVSNKPARAAGNIPQYTIGAALASIVLSVAKNLRSHDINNTHDTSCNTLQVMAELPREQTTACRQCKIEI